MSFLKSLFRKDPADEQQNIAAIESTMVPFLSSAMATVDATQLQGSQSMQKLAMAFVFGAAAYLAEYDGLSDAVGRKLAGDVTRKQFGVNDADLEEFVKQLMRAPDRDPGRFFMIEGASALRRFVAFQDDSYARRLGRMLAEAASRRG